MARSLHLYPHSDRNLTALSELPTVHICMHISWFSYLPVASEKMKWKMKDMSEARAEINTFLLLAPRRQDGFPCIWVSPWETSSGGWHTWGPVLGLGWNRTRKGSRITLKSPPNSEGRVTKCRVLLRWKNRLKTEASVEEKYLHKLLRMSSEEWTWSKLNICFALSRGHDF